MKKRIFIILLLIIFLLSLSYGYFYLNKEFGFIVECLFYKYSGFYCPACGITRSFFALIKGDLIQAFNYNQLVFCLLPIFLIYFIYKCYLFIFNKKDNFKIPSYIYILFLVIFIGFGILRNLDGFSILVP